MSLAKIIHIAGLTLLAALFAYEAYVILMDPYKSADTMFKQYADFRIWSNKSQRTYFGGKTLLEFPSTEYVKPYKSKAVHFIAYIYLIGAFAMVIGEQSMGIAVGICHCLHAFMKHNPWNVDPVGAQAKYDNYKRSFWVEMILFFAILIITVEKHPLAAEPVKSSKVKVDKKKAEQ